MRVVLDTVVLVRSLLAPHSWWGRLVFDHAQRYEFVVSPAIVGEYFDVLKRPRLNAKFRTVVNRDLPAILDFIATATVVQPLEVPAICRDPADDKFLAAATVGKAQFIVSEDADLLDIGHYDEITIISAEAFLRLFEPEP